MVSESHQQKYHCKSLFFYERLIWIGGLLITSLQIMRYSAIKGMRLILFGQCVFCVWVKLAMTSGFLKSIKPVKNG
jgi:hypothetical protein